MRRQRRYSAFLFFAAILLGRLVLADAYDPPAGYYSAATGTGATLKNQLNAIVTTGDTSVSYDTARSALQVTDADPNNAGHMLLVYNRVSVDLAAIVPTNPPNIPGWDSGTTWNREHTWPISRGLGSESIPDGSDLFNLRPSTPSVNSDRGNLNFGGTFGAQPYGEVIDGGNTLWYPGDADASMIARQEFFMAVRYDGSDSGTQNLELGTGNVPDIEGYNDPPPQLGDLNRLVEWHFAAVPDSFERRRNQIIYDNYQHNRNPFTDHPEFVWSIFVNPTNDSRIGIGEVTVNGDGSSTRDVDLGRVFVGGAVPAAQAFALNKTGNNGTYVEVATTGAATSSLSGRYNAFRTSMTDSKSINVGLNTNTTTAGLRSGSVVVDNLDITTGGGTGHGANDANDTFNVSLTVLDHATPSFAMPTLTTSLIHDFGSVAMGSSAPTFNFDLFNLVATPGFTANMDFDGVMSSGDAAVLTTNLATAVGSSLAAGSGQSFAAMLSTAAVGSFSATYTLMFSDENLPGAQNKSLLLTLMGGVILAGDYNGDGAVDAADYTVWRFSYGLSVTPFSGADGDGSGTIDDPDYEVWTAHFGEIAPGAGAGTAAVPEPAGVWLAASALALLAARRSLAR